MQAAGENHEEKARLDEIERTTIGHYQQSADRFWEGTRDHDVSQNRDALLRHIQEEAPLRILDFGCGPGRDLIAFRDMGHEPVGLDGAARFCEMAREHSGCDVWHQSFLELDLPDQHFHGVFANASLFHVPGSELPRVLRELRAGLRQGGVLFVSNPRGEDQEGWNGARYGAWHSEASWCRAVTQAGFVALEQYYRPPGQPRHLQPWFATVWRRLD